MKKTNLFVTVLFVALSASANAKNVFSCFEDDGSGNTATLTYLQDGSGNLKWNDESHSASSVAEPNSFEEFGDVYTLVNFAEGFELVVNKDLADSRNAGKVVILAGGQIESTYNCK